MNTDRPASELPAIEHEVVGLGSNRHWVGLDEVDVFGVGHRKGVVRRLKVTVLVDALKEGKLRHPDVAVRTFSDRRRSQRDAQRAQHVAGLGVLVGNDEHEVADLCAIDLGKGGRLVGAEESSERRIETLRRDAKPGESLGTE